MAGVLSKMRQQINQPTGALAALAPERNDRFLHYYEANNEMNLTPQEQDLYSRHLSNLYGPGGVDNPDGSRSSLYQAVQEHNGVFYNIPTVWDGKILTEKWAQPGTGRIWDIPSQQAIQNVEGAGWNSFPSYSTPEEADARYERMHGYLERDTADFLKRRRR